MFWIFRFFSVWPLAVLHVLGGWLGWLVWALSARYRAEFRANVAQAGLPFDAARPAIAEVGRFVAELPRIWLRADSRSCLDKVRVEGQAHAESAFAQQHGVIFFGAHCGSFELGSQALAELLGPAHGPVTAMYRPARKAWLARLEQFARNHTYMTMVPAALSGIRLMHKTLKANRAVGLLADQVPPDGMGIWTPVFGRPAYTMTLAARLALQTGAALLPVSCERLPHGRGYVLKIWPAVADLEPKDPAAATQDKLLHAVAQINRAVEAIVLSLPSQYLWAYARYKNPRKEAA